MSEDRPTTEDPIATRTRVPPVPEGDEHRDTGPIAIDQGGSEEYDPIHPHTRTPSTTHD